MRNSLYTGASFRKPYFLHRWGKLYSTLLDLVQLTRKTSDRSRRDGIRVAYHDKAGSIGADFDVATRGPLGRRSLRREREKGAYSLRRSEYQGRMVETV